MSLLFLLGFLSVEEREEPNDEDDDDDEVTRDWFSVVVRRDRDESTDGFNVDGYGDGGRDSVSFADVFRTDAALVLSPMAEGGF